MPADQVREFFDTQQLPLDAYLVIAAVAVAWLVLLRYVYATHVFERYFGMELVERNSNSTSRPRAVRS